MWITLKQASEKLKAFYAEKYIICKYKELFPKCNILWRIEPPRHVRVDSVSIDKYLKKRK